MDRRACPSYEAGFDACDPLGSVLGWSGDSRAARVLRRRCRSEGVERSPFEDALRASTQFEQEYRRQYPNKSHFTLSSGASLLDRFRHECALPAHNGDYFMAHEQNRMHGFPSSFNPARIKAAKSPTRPHLVTTLSNAKLDDRLPKVEELLEKVDQEMLELTKQPLKSILNHPPMQKTLPQSILKKPKCRPHSESKSSLEGRRRQRASSESDNHGCTFRLSSPIPTYDNRLGYLSTNTKRAKDNSGTGYSYGSAIASLNPSPTMRSAVASPICKRSRSPNGRTMRCACKEAPPLDANQTHVLRTTAITNDNAASDTAAAVKSDIRSTSAGVRSAGSAVRAAPMRAPPPACPPLPSPAPPVSPSPAPAPPAPSKKKPAKKKKGKAVKGKPNDNNDEEELLSRSPSPDCDWQMETDAVLAEIAQLERPEKGPSTTPVAGPLPTPTPLPPPPPPISAHTVTVTSPTMQPPKPTVDVNTPNKIVSKFVSGQKKKDDKEKTKDSIFLTALYTNNPFKAYPTRKESPLCIPESVTNCLRISLFPRVPPYLKFVSHDETAPLKIPNGIQKHLKWKMTSITPIVVKKTLTNSGFRLVKSECDTSECPQEETVEWIGIWGKHMKSIMFRAIKDGQKMNHFPGTFQIGRKDRLWRNLQKLTAKHGMKEFGIMPKTYVLPHDLKILKHDWEKYAANNEKWIIKPPASARGTGIKVVSRWTQIPKKRAVVVQKYVSKPYLINGSKFDLRLYVLVTSVHPLRIYLFKDGLARFASVKYNDEISSLNDRYMHLTNYSINRLSKNYTPNEDFSACEGHKWTLQSLFHYLKSEKGVNTQDLWKSIKDLVIKTIISGEASISSLTKANITSRYNCYELFGIDVLLDEDLKPWLLEVNISPSLHSASPLDIHVKGPLVSTVLNIAQFQVPIKTSLESLSKEKPNKLDDGFKDWDLNPPLDPNVIIGNSANQRRKPRLTKGEKAQAKALKWLWTHPAGLPYDCRLYTVYLSKEERDKHIIYTNMEERDMYLRDILSTLTPDDVRHLIQAEDELTQAGDMERIFPTSETHKYLGFLAGPRYYNRLFDAWETRYSFHREPGLELLRNLCDIGYHLEVPPVPLKNDVDAPSPPASERPSVTSVEVVSSGSVTAPCGDGASAAPSLGEAAAPPPPPPPVPAKA